MPYGLRPMEQYKTLPISQLDKWEKLTNGKLVLTVSFSEFNEALFEMEQWNALHEDDTGYRLQIRYIGLGLFNIIGNYTEQ